MMYKDVYIVVPAKDEEPRIGGVLKKVRSLGYENIVVVNDGSEDNTADIARYYGATVVSHLVNLGAGAATQTGIEYAIAANAKTIVTIDADHQHLPEDIKSLVNTLERENADIVIGSRFLRKDNKIPTTRRIYNKIANIITFIFTGIRVTDSQSGMKAFRASYAEKAALTSNGFEFSVEMIKHISRNNAKIIEVPISVIYTKDTLSKGQNFLTGVRMLIRIAQFGTR